MSAVISSLTPAPKKGGKGNTLPASGPVSGPAAANAAAASFAALTAKLDYLSPTDIDLVRRAYRFADEAHLLSLIHI